LAGRQHGVVSRAQLVELGLGRHGIARRLESKRLHRLHAGVYAVGHRALTVRSRYLAGVFACGPQALLSHRSAAALWRFMGSSAVAIEVTAPRGIKAKPDILVHRTRLIHAEDRTTIDGIPTTGMARTLVDLADVLDERRLAAAINEAEVLRVLDMTALEATLGRLPGRKGRDRLSRALAAYTDDPGYSRSEAERLFLRLCAGNGLPTPSRIAVAGYELDFYWPDARLAIEVDGAAFHRTRRAFHEDRRRDRRLAALGVQVARIPWRDLTSGDGSLVAELQAIRSQRPARP